MKPKKIFAAVGCIILPLAVGLLSSWIAGDLRSAYAALSLPPLSPPGWLFGVVWPALYVLMGVALFLALDSSAPRGSKVVPAILFGVQLLLNFLWSPVFFRLNMLWAAFVVILLLDAAVVACIVSFYRLRKVAGLLLLPYALWLLFATYLNVACAILN